jgi:hypothetical protein
MIAAYGHADPISCDVGGVGSGSPVMSTAARSGSMLIILPDISEPDVLPTAE